MKRQIATWLALSCLLYTFSPALAATVQADSQKTVIQATVEKTQATTPEKSPEKSAKKSQVEPKDELSGLSIQREYTYVAPDQIPTQITAILEEKGSTSEDVNNKILGGYIPVLITINNKSDKLLKIPSASVYYVDTKGNTRLVPNHVEVFNHTKRHGVRRALAWSVPLGVASFGILLLPAALWSGVHTAVTNNSLKDDIQRSMLHDGHLGPESTTRAYVFLPDNGPTPMKLIFGRVINTEDGTETQQVVEITKKETVSHVTAK
jgi:hypothetical protein